jgi:hypothetical protein
MNFAQVSNGQGYRILDYERLQQRKPTAFNIITVPEIVIPQKENGTPDFVFPISSAREKATQEFQPFEFNALELDKIEERIEALADQEDIPLLEIDTKFLTPIQEAKKPRAVSVTLDRIIKYGHSPNCNACERGEGRHTNDCHERFASLLKDETMQCVSSII